MLQHIGYIDLPNHVGVGGFDHAAVHARTGRIFVAHTANDAVDVIDPEAGARVFSIPDLRGVAGVLISDESQLVFTSNRAENTIGIFTPSVHPDIEKIPVGLRPNGLAYDPVRRLVLVGNVGDAAVSNSHTLSIVGVDDRKVLAEIVVSGRSRWAVYDPKTEAFYVNIADPPQIVAVASRDPRRIAYAFAVPFAGPHGLDLDLASHRLFCACDAQVLVTLDARTGRLQSQAELSGVPDVIFFNSARRRLYVAIGNPGTIDVLDTSTMKRLESVPSEEGAHTLALAPARDQVYAFLPKTHRAAVYREGDC